MNIIIKDSSYASVNVITKYEHGSAAAYGDEFGSSSLNGANLDINDDPDMVYGENIYLNLDFIFNFSDGTQFIGSADTWDIAALLDNDKPSSIDDISCSDTPNTAQIIIPLQTANGSYVIAETDSTSGFLEMQLIILSSGSPAFKVCGLP